MTVGQFLAAPAIAAVLGTVLTVAVVEAKRWRRRRAAKRTVEAMLAPAIDIEARSGDAMAELDSLCRWAGAPKRGAYDLTRMELSTEQLAALVLLASADHRIAFVRPALGPGGREIATLCADVQRQLSPAGRAS